MPIADAPRSLAGTMSEGTYGTLALDLYETVPALSFPLSTQTYDKMRTDPKISSVLSAYELPLRAATWGVNPKGCRDEVVQLCADAWGLPILGDNDGPGPARRRGVDWDDHLRLALLMLPFGFSPFAMRFDVTGTPLRARLAELAERLPQSISSIETNPDGSLKGIHQNGRRDLIPAANLLWYVRNREGAAWQGRSMLRNAYAPWLLKHEMLRVLAQSSRRFGMGIPEVTAPAGSPPADVTRAAQIAAGFRAGDQAGVGMPDGFTFNLKGMTGSAPDTLGFVRYLDSQITSMALADVLNLDASPNGSRALGDTLVGLLELSWEATARAVAGPATAMNVRIVDYNWGEDEPVPAVLCTDVTRPEITSEAIASLVQCGALTPDLALENNLRVRYDLPVIEERPEPVAVAPVTPEVEQGRTNEPAPEPVAAP